ncbi:MAG: pseudaminic acid synthase [Deltaproteobacteria bacterium]|nr:pseudaminic acid synthase [Deltaproteobacteria bacterium]
MIQIGKYSIGENEDPFVIAEMSGNHNGSLARALQIVEAAAQAGAQALKLQTYTADTMTLNLSENEFVIQDKNSLWKNRTLYDLYHEAHTPWEWHEPLFKRCAELGMIGFSTPFDETAVDFLEKLNVPCYKIASFENIHLPLIKKVAATKKPLIISTGLATLEEISEAVDAARSAGCRDLILLKCTSSYPAPPEESNLLAIDLLKQRFQCEVGLSDHTMGIGVSLASIALGARVIERHFTLSRSDGGVDSAFSLEPQELKMLREESKKIVPALGKTKLGPSEQEKKSLQFRRSLYISENMKAGEILTPKNLRAIRPGLGLAPKYYEELLGKKVKQDLKKGMAMKWEWVGE